MVLDFDSEVIVDNVTYQAKPLHTVPKFIEECCHLINLEWPRSYTARYFQLDYWQLMVNSLDLIKFQNLF